MPDFTLYQDNDYAKAFISERQHNGSFPFYLVIQVEYLREISGNDEAPEFYGTLLVVSPKQARPKYLANVLRSNGLPEDAKVPPEEMVALMVEYGLTAPLAVRENGTYEEIEAYLRDEAAKASMLFGFYMDRPVNPLGATGWDAIKGDLVPKKLRKKSR